MLQAQVSQCARMGQSNRMHASPCAVPCFCAVQIVMKKYSGLHSWWNFKAFAAEVITHTDFAGSPYFVPMLWASLDMEAGTATLVMPKTDGDIRWR